MPSAARWPIASRAAIRVSAAAPIDGRGSKIPSLASTGTGSRTQGQPSSTSRSTSATASSPKPCRVVAKHGTRSRWLPPRSWYTGTPSERATKSCRAMSMADSAAVSTRPPSKY